MAEFKVETTQLRACSDRIEDLQRQMNEVAAKMTGLQIGSVLQIKASTALIGKITDCKWATINQSFNLGKLARGLDDVADLYDRNENNLKAPKTAAQAIIGQGAQVIEHITDGDTDSDSDWRDYFPSWKEFLEWLGKKSVPFSLASALVYFHDGDAKSVVKGLKSLTYAIGNGTKAIFNTKEGGTNADWFQRLMGFGANDTTGLRDSWQKYWDSVNLSKQTTTAGKVAVVAKWAGYALTVAGNAIDNYKEYQNGGISGGRAVGETVVESAVDIGLSIGAGVLVAAALPATASAIVVGVISGGVVWATNEVVKHYFGGRDFAEVFADVACDTAEWFGKRVQDVGEGFGNALGGVCKWARGLFG